MQNLFKKFVIIGTIAVMVTIFAGCEKETSNSKMTENSLKILAENYFSSNEEPQSSIEKVQSLSEDEYNIYLSFWIKAGIQKMIEEKVVPESQRVDAEKQELEKRKLYNQKALELYSTPMYKLSIEEQLNVVNALNGSGNISFQQKATCPKYYYPTVVQNDGSGTYSCVAVYNATNPADTDCDWEFAYNIGNNIVYGKAKTSSIAASAIFAYGGINWRRPEAPENVSHRRFLVGYDKIDLLYPGSGYSAALLFASDVKFRGLTMS